MLQPYLLRHGPGRLLVIAREHVHLDTALLQVLHRLPGGGFDPIGNGQDRQHLMAVGKENHRLGLFLQGFGLRLGRLVRGDPVIGQ